MTAVLDELADAAASMDHAADPVARGTGVLYWNPVKGTTVDTPFGKVLGRKSYKATTTNRNLRTLAEDRRLTADSGCRKPPEGREGAVDVVRSRRP